MSRLKAKVTSSVSPAACQSAAGIQNPIWRRLLSGFQPCALSESRASCTLIVARRSVHSRHSPAAGRSCMSPNYFGSLSCRWRISALAAISRPHTCFRSISSTPAACSRSTASPTDATDAPESGTTQRTLIDLAEALHDDPNLAKQLTEQLDGSGRHALLRAWEACQGSDAEVPAPKTWQLCRLAVFAGLPMVGFGFMDNFIMILAGDFIDATMCFHLGLTTMCAAGIGNIISDVTGLAAAGPIESALVNIGLKGPGLSHSQMKLWSVLTAKYAGSAIGMCLGCIIGMFPLLWPEEHRLWTPRSKLEASPHDSAE